MKDTGGRSAGHDPARVRAQRAWTFVLCAVSLSAVGAIIGAVFPWPDNDATPSAAPAASSSVAAPATTAASSAPPTPAAPNVVEEPFDPKAPIPGCATVEQPDPGSGTIISRLSSGTPSYDNPRFPWFSGPKATAMSNAVADQLPPRATIDFANPSSSLFFGPILDLDESAPDPEGSTIASGSLTNGDAHGSVFLTVQKTSAPVPPCVAGQLDARRTLPDGTIVDVHDTWREVDGVRTNTRSADATATDGSRITANAGDTLGNTQQSRGAVPLTIDDLVRIVGDPRLRVSTPVPPGTPPPAQGCGDRSFGTSNGPAVTREQARRLDGVLATIDFGGRRPAPLQVAEGSSSTLCTTVPGGNGAPARQITITGGQSLPPQPRPDPVSNPGTWRTLADGSVVQTQNLDTVIVTRTNGTRVTVSNDGAPPASLTSPTTELESIALTPGLKL
ncbi:hypothetical protein ASG12_06515 [Williamsia sp. Leaf354]|uniref:hypothetical protein n=1 Tax=Williamsia sp. Leaf354 TaxID=1736349 RepID=UPI0006F50747|nr:hypothetical protein [Williamsia sp. Leaf354]KQS01016.1 hypothetical protein ASG12_06515 [Williamsia sp. Leaf354]